MLHTYTRYSSTSVSEQATAEWHPLRINGVSFAKETELCFSKKLPETVEKPHPGVRCFREKFSVWDGIFLHSTGSGK